MAKGIEIEVKSVPDKFLKMLIYGKTGTGKTRLAASAEQCKEMSPVLVIDFDKGLQSVDWKVSRVTVDDYAQFQAALKEGLSGKYKTIVFDTLTELYRVLIFESIRLAKIEAQSKGKSHDVDLPEQRDYFRAHEMFRRIIRAMRDANVHFLGTAQQAYAIDPISNAVIGISPMISGRLNEEVGAHFALIAYLEANKDRVTELHTEQMYQTITKDRANKIPGVLENPSMPEIYDYYFGSPKEAKKAKR